MAKLVVQFAVKWRQLSSDGAIEEMENFEGLFMGKE
jgi:hypothetical protein